MKLNHTHPEKYSYFYSDRKHGRPPRFFVVCSVCGKEFQAVKNTDGTIHVFTTNEKRSNKKVYSFRLSENGADKIRKMIATGEIN